jgi:PAS domain S-box-containing protein
MEGAMGDRAKPPEAAPRGGAEGASFEVALSLGLLPAEERYRALIEAVREIICTVTRDGLFTSFNPAFAVLTGWSADEWLARPFRDLVHPEDVPACVEAFEIALRGEMGPVVRHRLRKRDGGWLSVESTGSPLFRDGRVDRVLGVLRDLTDRVEAEEALAASRQRFTAVFENALDAILLCDDRGRYIDANPAACALLGYGREDLLGLNVTDLQPAEYAETAGEVLREFAARGRYSGEYRLRHKNGHILDAEFRAVADILPGVHLAIVRDVTDRKRAEEELRRSQRRLEEAEAVAHVGSWEWDVATNDLTWTAELYRLFGVTPETYTPTYNTSLDRVHPADRHDVDAFCRAAAASGQEYTWEARILQPDGEVRVIHSRGHPVKDAQGRVVRMVGIAQDITERTRDDQVRRALVQRLISVHEEERARLSRELHDGTGQSLAALLVGLQRMEGSPSLGAVRLAAHRQREMVAQIIDDVGRLARGLRPTVLDDLGLCAALQRLATDQAWLFGFDITVDAAALGRRRLPGPLETAFYRAAQEALANAARHAQPRQVTIKVACDSDEVRLTVTDDGRGFDVGQALTVGGRLGLHTIRERAEVLGGRAEIRSGPGRGTSITLAIPLPARRRRRGAAGRPRPAARRTRAQR